MRVGLCKEKAAAWIDNSCRFLIANAGKMKTYLRFGEVSMDNGEVIKKTNIEKTHVPDKVYTFMIQSHHMLYELLNCKDGDSVSV